jgi:hypothetical protein
MVGGDGAAVGGGGTDVGAGVDTVGAGVGAPGIITVSWGTKVPVRGAGVGESPKVVSRACRSAAAMSRADW